MTKLDKLCLATYAIAIATATVAAITQARGGNWSAVIAWKAAACTGWIWASFMVKTSTRWRSMFFALKAKTKAQRAEKMDESMRGTISLTGDKN
jgi:hypothetical protein